VGNIAHFKWAIKPSFRDNLGGELNLAILPAILEENLQLYSRSTSIDYKKVKVPSDCLETIKTYRHWITESLKTNLGENLET
jgi:hypothetical protein